MTVTTDRTSGAVDAPVTHQVALAFEDGVTRFITCRADQTVADASYRQRINIPLDCRDGACGTCKAFCESGDYDGGTYIDDALSEGEAADGYALPCCMKPRSDLVLQIAATSDIAKTQAATFTGKVVDLVRLSASTVKLAVRIPNRGDLAFLPGQYVNITVPGATDRDTGEPVTRSYSFSNGPHEEVLTFLVKLTAGGAMSTYLDERASVGDELTFTGPHGSFFLRDSARPVLLLAGGTGLAPILSILRKLHDDKTPRKAHLILGVSNDEDLVAFDEIEYFARELPGFTWDHCVSSPDTTAKNRGYVTSLIAPQHLYNGDVAIYLCGPPPMVESVRTHVVDAGIEPTGFYYEKFALAGARGAATEPVEVTPPAQTSIAATVLDDEEIVVVDGARSIGGQQILPASTIAAWTGARPTSVDGDSPRQIARQQIWPARESTGELDADDGSLVESSARAVAGQEVFGAVATAPLVVAEQTSPTTVSEPEPELEEPAVGAQGYQIGEEHPGVHESDAIFEARTALELGALELTFGRLSTQQLAGYRLLADATLPYVDADKAEFVDAAEYTETNAAFHDYLFTQTRNEHLLQAYSALGVKGRMGEVLRNATWCHPLCALDHVDIVEAFESGDKAAAMKLISAHGDRSKQTMRRAMADEMASRKPKFVTPGRFAGKVVVVTGAAQGIGEQVARRISAEGGAVVLADRSELVNELADDLRVDGRASAVTADLESYDGAQQVVRQALSAFGRIDVLVNNVGGAINFKPFVEFTDAEIRAEIDRSLLTTLYATRAVLPGMVEQGGGVIVNVSSAATRGINRIPYSAAKGGINAITASLAVEYADDGIRVVATAPGGTEAPPRRISRGTPTATTDQQKQWYQAHIDQTLDSSLMHRYGTLDEQAAAICFLASDEASYITGTVLPVAGGDVG
ncbi:1,6-dihydroxycyclohexa-2,4-diene-1-carboxylate dehydrogenase [Gordonia sp. TBRC 11910]|uniref:1,6-dihydroxycyclohexa-2,4-diene-1-carboxylate dehydrogenase n=1 Tax=Gordonia asplenii TaxID=2725283 RepID=A0A848KW12_9ACTN|nr:benzoate 1,2-dioxygenase electron transfer component BenC [Gordonia asplenii]NMO02856.1 1,6-dihydroxycyclohexa-2,4-diene-1-carboxylate dehydrogenase [Gordonia asplenii]